MNIFNQLLKFKIKPSVQRMAIMEYLFQNNTHPTVDEIYHALSPVIPTLSKTTVYNTLKLFTEQGAVQMLTIDEKNVCFDGVIEPHPHFLCKNCNKVFNLSSDYLINLEKYNTNEYIITEVHLYYKGLCNMCRK